MITATSRLTVRVLPLHVLTIKCYEDEPRNPGRVEHYVDLLQTHPEDYAGVLSVVPSDTYPGIYVVLDGHHRFCASILANRRDALCLVIEEGE